MTEEALSATLSTLETALESMTDGVLIFNPAGEIVQVNAAFKGALGVQCRIGMTRETYAENLSKSDAFNIEDQSAEKWMLSSLSADNTRTAQEKRISTPSGQHFICRMTPTADGGQVISLTDVSDIQTALISAEAAQTAKSEILANMSHEMRTPLNGIIGMTDLLRESDMGQREHHFVDTIQKCGSVLMKIINEILHASKIEAEQAQIDEAPFNLREGLEDVATLLATTAAAKDIDLLVRYRPALPSSFIGDIGRVRQVLTNLIGNAIKFTHDGHVLIDIDGDIERDVANLVIRVEDTGIGIPADQVDSVFERFRQVDGSNTRKYEGTGLGLSISASLVEMMGGEISVESVPEEGSVFTVKLSLPITEEITPVKPVPIEIIGSNILVIDDNAANGKILSEQISHWKCQSAAVDGAEKGLSVLRKAMAKNMKIDLVIVDFQMPEMSGEEFFDDLRADDELKDIPVLMLTSVNEDEMSRRLMSNGLAATLTKPARSSLLLDTIATCLRKSQSAPADLELESEQDLLDAWDLPAVKTPFAAPVAAAKVEAASPAPVVAKAADTEADDAAMEKDLGDLDILVAEDDETNQTYIEYILDDVDVTYKMVDDGAQAVESWKAQTPRIILMDISMPEMNGHEATQRIRDLEAEMGRERTPIIALTAHTLKGDKEKCLEAGMDDYLTKPVSVQDVKDALAKWDITEPVSEVG